MEGTFNCPKLFSGYLLLHFPRWGSGQRVCGDPPQWSTLLRCSCVLRVPPPGVAIPSVRLRCVSFLSTLVGKADRVSGLAASAMHAIAILQVHQAKVFKQLHKGSADQGQEARTATDLSLRVTKVTVWSLSQVMSTLVVPEHHLSLNLADMRESDWTPQLPGLPGLPSLFGDAVENFARQFSAAQKPLHCLYTVAGSAASACLSPRVTLCPLGTIPVPLNGRVTLVRLLSKDLKGSMLTLLLI